MAAWCYVQERAPLQPKADITLAESAMSMTALLQSEAKNTEAAQATGFDKVVLTLHQQMLKSGKDAEAFKEVPPNNRDPPARLELSQQATNYLLTALYGQEKLHQASLMKILSQLWID